jgi:aminoglycoside phosphotransferase (APT) family kinase protein
VLAVLDWELSTLGHSAVRTSRTSVDGVGASAPQQFRGLKGCDFCGARHSATEAEYVAAYCRRTGRDAIPHWDIYLIFNMFRIAAILARRAGPRAARAMRASAELPSNRRPRPTVADRRRGRWRSASTVERRRVVSRLRGGLAARKLRRAARRVA